MEYRSLWATCVFLMFAFHIDAQNDNKESEFEHWEGLELEYPFNKRLALNLSVQSRWKANPSELNAAFFEMEPEYELFKNLNIGGGYRYITDFEDKRERLFAHLEPDVELTKDFKLDIRIRYDYEWESDETEQRLRMRLKPEYDFGKIEVFSLAELFMIESRYREKWRYGLGVQYKFGEGNMLEMRGLVDSELYKNVWILFVGYSYDF